MNRHAELRLIDFAAEMHGWTFHYLTPRTTLASAEQRVSMRPPTPNTPVC